MNNIPDSIVLVLRAGLGQRARRLGVSICDYLEQGSPASLRLSCDLLLQIGAVTKLLGGRRIGAFCAELERLLKSFNGRLNKKAQRTSAVLLCQGVVRICDYCESFTAPEEDAMFAMSLLDELRQARGKQALPLSGVDAAAELLKDSTVRPSTASAAVLNARSCVAAKLQKIAGLMNASVWSFEQRNSNHQSKTGACVQNQTGMLREFQELASVLQVLGVLDSAAKGHQLASTWQTPAQYLGIELRLGRLEQWGCGSGVDVATSITVSRVQHLLRVDAESSLLRLLSIKLESTAACLQAVDADFAVMLEGLRRVYLLGAMLPRGEHYTYWMQQLDVCLMLARHLYCWSQRDRVGEESLCLLAGLILRISAYCKEFGKALLKEVPDANANAITATAAQKMRLRKDKTAVRKVIETHYDQKKHVLNSELGAQAAMQKCFHAELVSAVATLAVKDVPSMGAGSSQVSDGLMSMIDLLAANTHCVGYFELYERVYELRCLLSLAVEKQLSVVQHLPDVLQALHAVLKGILSPAAYTSAEFYDRLAGLDKLLLEWAPVVQVQSTTGLEEARLSMGLEAGMGVEIISAKQLPVYLASNLRLLLRAPAVLADPVALENDFGHLNRKWLVELRMLTTGARALRVHRIAAISAALGDLHQSFSMAQALPQSLLPLLLETHQVLRRSLNQAAAWQEVSYAGELVNALYHALENQSVSVYETSFMSAKDFAGFRAEAEELMEKIQSVFACSTWRIDSEPRQTLFSCLHTLKGNARLFACDALASICHRCESFLLALPAAEAETASAVSEAPNVLNYAEPAGSGIEVILYGVKELREAVDSLADDERCKVPGSLPPHPIPQENCIAVPIAALQKTASLAAKLHRGINALADIVDALEERQELAGLTTAQELLREQMHCVTQLEEEIAGARRVSFARLVPRLQRLGARHSSLLDKQVRLLVHDVDLCAERSLVERLVAPLEHLLRNAIDHGIETPAVRRSCGKAEIGTVEIHMQEAAGALCVSMRDDGAGIDARLLPQGLDSVFLPGLSTKPHANADAGHGLGLAAVRAAIVSLGGSVALSSVLGQGSCFTLRLPVSGGA